MSAEGWGRPVTFLLTSGERQESTVLGALLRQGAIKHWRAGRPRLYAHAFSRDKTYSSRDIQGLLRQRHIRYATSRRRDKRPTGRFDQDTYRERSRMERLFNRLKRFRRAATRYEKRAAIYLAMVTLASILIWLRFAVAP